MDFFRLTPQGTFEIYLINQEKIKNCKSYISSVQFDYISEE
jgi:hypothetical protein